MCLIHLFAAPLAFSQSPPPDYGFNFTTIGDVGNAPYIGNKFFDDRHLRNRGSVSYEYRIAQTEIRTSDWVEFANHAYTFDIPVMAGIGARYWGAAQGIDPTTGKRIYALINEPGSGDWPVGGISWRAAATYCNWLHNDKALTPEAFLTGAYDLSTFGDDPDTFRPTDQARRSPGARYWIPSTDEWMKAVHYDPDKDGVGQGGWWTYPDGSDTKPKTGLPGTGETNTGLANQIGGEAWKIPVGSYPEIESPWGLLDTSGGASEWLEDWLMQDDPLDRVTNGSSIQTNLPPEFDPDLIGRGNIARRPNDGVHDHGLRLASAAPSPTTGIVLVLGLSMCNRRKR